MTEKTTIATYSFKVERNRVTETTRGQPGRIHRDGDTPVGSPLYWAHFIADQVAGVIQAARDTRGPKEKGGLGYGGDPLAGLTVTITLD